MEIDRTWIEMLRDDMGRGDGGSRDEVRDDLYRESAAQLCALALEALWYPSKVGTAVEAAARLLDERTRSSEPEAAR